MLNLFKRIRSPKNGLVNLLVLLIVLSLQLAVPYQIYAAPASQQAQTPEPNPTATADQTEEAVDQASLLLDEMTPEERVGQLFLISFSGSDTSPETDIYDLVTNYHIGGVILRSANDNITLIQDSQGSTARGVIGLNRQLQIDRWQTSLQPLINPISGETYSPTYVPLFIGISQEGGGYPFDEIFNDLTQLPNLMSIGATWDPDQAQKVGTIMGVELSALGFNMLLGPSLDILEVTQLNGANNLGVRTFGGDPYWVGEMGKSYIEGVHLGSDGQVAVIAKHFPGQGGSDRDPAEEVATVRKTLDQLESFELIPFYEVTGGAPNPESTTDGLLTSHIRYQGFQGNIRATTRPVSFDPQALSLLMELPEFMEWRDQEGILVSDDLGSEAIRRFYELTSQPFDMPRRVALNAFLAGNDLLYIADFSSGDLDSVEAAKQTLEFFSQKYREDAAFTQRVDESVLRILRLKYDLYGDFTLDRVLAPAGGDSLVGNSDDVTFEVAFEASTLLSPSQADLDETSPDPPDENDRLVLISDTRNAQQCSDCVDQPILGLRDLEEMIVRRYGPDAGGQVTPSNLISYSINDLEELLTQERVDLPIERSLERANWIVFALLDASGDNPSYNVLDQFLTNRPDLFQQKRVIVFALNAPYFLDATNISKLTAYYALYSNIEQFIDVAAYLLFKEHIAPGASPVSVPGTGYDINIAVSPDPDQQIPLFVELAEEGQGEETETTPEPTPTPTFRIGDVIPVRTGIIVDANGNPVPDNTIVEFTMITAGELTPITQVETTIDGQAGSSFSVNHPGVVEIYADSGLATSEILNFDIPSPADEAIPENETLEVVAPTQQANPSAETTLSEVTPTQIPVAPESDQPIPPEPQSPYLLEWAIAIVISIGLGFLSYRVASINSGERWGARAGFLVLIGGSLAYVYLVLDLPGSQELIDQSMYLAVIIVTVIGTVMGMIGTITWRLADEFRLRRSATNNK